MIQKLVLGLLFFFMALAAHSQNDKLLAGCCEAKPKEEGRCTGSAYCSACSNCSRCAHCSSGGSCGVCASYSAPVKPAVTRSVRKRAEGGVAKKPASLYSNGSAASTSTSAGVNSNSKNAPATKVRKGGAVKKELVTFVSGDMLAVGAEILKLREEAGEEYPVLEVLKKYDMLQLIALDGEWLQVKVVESGNYGFVRAQYVYKI
ncbi:hypothetical protein [Flavobacterium johnsoniae]|uniref:hypothetical protein n=1 Tax=Flavobacterium johnsoniae TaxID=986 RepID=UPI003D9776C7